MMSEIWILIVKNKKKFRTCRIVDTGILADHKVIVKEIELRDKY